MALKNELSPSYQVYFGPQMEKNITRVLTDPQSVIIAIVSPVFRVWTCQNFTNAKEWL